VLPRDFIFHLLTKMHPLDKGLKFHKLSRVVDGYGDFILKFCDPLIVMEGLCDGPLFLFANLKDFWLNILWHPSRNPWGIPKRGLATIPKGNGSDGIEISISSEQGLPEPTQILSLLVHSIHDHCNRKAVANLSK
jgi:hypothetical protein